jgi:hypothetical protein
MVPPKPEETLHNYLRRYFEKVSAGMKRRFPEQREVPSLEAIPEPWPSGESGSKHAQEREIAPVS